MINLVRLKGKTQKGKNRVRELGDVWKVKEIQTFTAGTENRYERILIEPAEQKGRRVKFQIVKILQSPFTLIRALR